MPLVLEAARHEFRKLEKTVSESDFHWQQPCAPVIFIETFLNLGWQLLR